MANGVIKTQEDMRDLNADLAIEHALYQLAVDSTVMHPIVVKEGK